MTDAPSAATRERLSPGGAPLRPPTVDEGVELARAGRMEEARAVFERVLAADPGNADAYNNLGVLHMQTGDGDTAVAMFEQAYGSNPLDRQIRENCLLANFMKALELDQQHKYLPSIEHYRRVLALDPDHVGARMNLTIQLIRAGLPGERGDFLADANAPLGHHILIACMPKSGSSLLFEALHRLTGWEKAFFAYGYMQNEQELYLPNIRAVAASNTVTQQHCRATNPNVHILQGFGIRPIVLVRNLADIVMSMVDFFDGGAVHNSFLAPDWENMKPELKRDAVIDHLMPWYVGFYASWRRVEMEKRLDCLFVRYEDMIADKPGTLKAIADFHGIDKTVEDCAAAVAAVEGNRTATRFNKGVAGRGAEALTDEQQARLKRIAAPYHSIDFSPVGL